MSDDKRPDAWYEGHAYAMRDVAHALGREDVTIEELSTLREVAEAARDAVALADGDAFAWQIAVKRLRAALRCRVLG